MNSLRTVLRSASLLAGSISRGPTRSAAELVPGMRTYRDWFMAAQAGQTCWAERSDGAIVIEQAVPIGLNLLAARAFGFYYASRASVPMAPVLASMQSEDSMLGGESLYIAELQRARAACGGGTAPQRVSDRRDLPRHGFGADIETKARHVFAWLDGCLAQPEGGAEVLRADAIPVRRA